MLTRPTNRSTIWQLAHTLLDEFGNRGASKERRENTDTKPVKRTAAGGGYSTAGDLLRFNEALSANKLLSSKYTKMVLNGFREVKDVAGKLRGAGGFAGGSDGINAVYNIDDNKGSLVVVLVNFDPPLAQNIARKISRMPILNQSR